MAFLNILLKWFSRLILPGNSKRILVVRLDAIGDYILFRNYLPYIKEYAREKKYKITFLGNNIYKEIAEAYDSKFVDDFIWVNPKILQSNLFNFKLEKIKLIVKLKLNRFDILINSVHSRTTETDKFISALGCKFLIGSLGDKTNFNTVNDFELSKNNYDQLINVDDISHFEFFRNRTFFKNLFPEFSINPSLSLPAILNKKSKERNIVIFPGAGSILRRWDPGNFAAIINSIGDVFDWAKFNFLIIGSFEEKNIALEIKEKIKSGIRYQDMAGSLNLVQIVDLIANSFLLISNETSAVHIAAAVQTTTICISNGNHFARFNPYGPKVSKVIYTVYPNEDFYNEAFIKELIYKSAYQSDFDINSITVDRVKSKAFEIILHKLK